MMRAMRSCCGVSGRGGGDSAGAGAGAGIAGAAQDVPLILLTAGTWCGCAGESVGGGQVCVRLERRWVVGDGLSAMMAQLMPKS